MKNFNQQIYRKQSLNSLILFAIYSVSKEKKKCTFERIVKECFVLFPKIFSFPSVSQWPDARKLEKPLWVLRERKLIKGNPSTSFTLTSKGKKAVQDFSKVFGQKSLL